MLETVKVIREDIYLSIQAMKARHCSFSALSDRVTNHKNKKDMQDKESIISVGRCVIPCAFFGKSVKHTFSCRKMYSV